MKKISYICIVFASAIIAITGCEAAKDAANTAKDKAANMADIDFGDFDMKGLQDQIKGITDGFKDVSTDNVDGLASKISDLTGSIDGMGIGDLSGAAKTFAGGAISKFIDTIKAAMEAITDEGILGKLKPVVEPLLEKLTAFK